MKKLLVFSCCLIVAALSVFWFGCKNEISLGAEGGTPTLTLSKEADSDKITASLDGVEEGKTVNYLWYHCSEIGEVIYCETHDTGNEHNLGRATISTLCVAIIDKDQEDEQQVLSNMIDNKGNTISIYTLEKNWNYYKGEISNPTIKYGKDENNKSYEWMNDSFVTYASKYTAADTGSNVTDIKDIGIYKVSVEVTFKMTDHTGKTEKAIEATRTEDLGYYAIVPPTSVTYSDKLTYGSSLNISVLSNKLPGTWKFENSDTDEIIPTVWNDGYSILMTDAYGDDVLDSFANKELDSCYDKEKQAWKSKLKVTNVQAKELTSKDVNVTLKEESTVCSGDVWKPEITVTLKDNTELEEGKDYKLGYPADMISEGEKEITVTFKGNYRGFTTVKCEITPNEWGKLVIDGEYKYWVDDDGRTSAKVVKGKNIWLKEASDGSSAWYGLDNTNSVFTEGSRFWVKWLQEGDKEEWEKYYEQLDDEHKKKVDNNRLWIFLCGVTAPDGNEYKSIATATSLYVQLGSDWDKDDIRSVFISEAVDEPVESVEYISDFKDSPTKTGEYAKLKLKHFSPYAIYDELTDEEKEMLEKIMNGDISEDELNNMISEADLNEPTTPDNDDSLSSLESSEPSISYITGDQRGYVIVIAVSALIIAGVTLLFSLKNKKNK